MKRWLDRWRISRSLDEGTPLAPATERRLRADPELRRHHERLAALGRELGREARAWRAAPSAQREQRAAQHEQHAAQAPAARLQRASGRAASTPARLRSSKRARLRPALLVLAGAAAIVLVLFGTRQLLPDQLLPGTDADAGAQRAATLAHEAGRATSLAGARSSLDRLAQRTSALSPAALGKSGEQVLLQEARNVARDARRLATHLAERVSFARGRAPDGEPAGDRALPR